jgi:hypothetical protein
MGTSKGVVYGNGVYFVGVSLNGPSFERFPNLKKKKKQKNKKQKTKKNKNKKTKQKKNEKNLHLVISKDNFFHIIFIF